MVLLSWIQKTRVYPCLLDCLAGVRLSVIDKQDSIFVDFIFNQYAQPDTCVLEMPGGKESEVCLTPLSIPLNLKFVVLTFLGFQLIFNLLANLKSLYKESIIFSGLCNHSPSWLQVNGYLFVVIVNLAELSVAYFYSD